MFFVFGSFVKQRFFIRGNNGGLFSKLCEVIIRSKKKKRMKALPPTLSSGGNQIAFLFDA